ncbi:hypothetical protein HU200_057636 [Digitaria exilis]|uniref:Uncharacterized protein n=1 Tax=Digitaria exilis TaxID=1010633 RepID=A0A835AJG1_9POAL|nr:hypothetical protein HU200_057636 [Digitaria exilis]
MLKKPCNTYSLIVLSVYNVGKSLGYAGIQVCLLQKWSFKLDSCLVCLFSGRLPLLLRGVFGLIVMPLFLYGVALSMVRWRIKFTEDINLVLYRARLL